MTGQNTGHCIRKHAQKNIRRQLDAKMNRTKVYGKSITKKQCEWLKGAFLEFQHHVYSSKTWIINFLEPGKHHGSQLATTRDQLVMTLSDFYWWPTTRDVLVRPENTFLQFGMALSIYSGLCNVQTGITSSEGIAYQMKFDVEFPSQMTETCLLKKCWTLLHASWKETHGADQRSWCGIESV
jgi:hypothetical protein